ncbi:J domain-containing protein [Sphingomonas profundi]|uniref:J domain-containing protein n=1 Tax=Alterirhizorhabdus profundi TaxID=2681549 RepID=UPI0012E85256|nr:J domain-containing protein [Sphingomonas profundi]
MADEGQGQARRSPRFHGRVGGGDRRCEWDACGEAGEFRAPPREGRRPGDGPGAWRWFCLDHVREFNGGYNFFEGMSMEEIEREQRPFAGWERETRAFAANAGATPRWADFVDPLDAIGAKFARERPAAANGHLFGEAERRALKVLGLAPDADRRALRQRYADLLRRYHPDRNGGDRAHEKALRDVIAAYTALKSSPAFA